MSDLTNVAGLKSQDDFVSFILSAEQHSRFVVSGGPVECAAPASKVFAALCDSSTWKDWCSFVPQIEVKQPDTTDTPSSLTDDTMGNNPPTDSDNSKILVVGTKMKWGLVMDPKNPQKLTSSELIVDGKHIPQRPDKTYYLTWSTTNAPKWVHYGRRVWQIEDVGDGRVGSKVTTTDFQNGPMAWLVKMIYEARLRDAFQESAEELSSYCEQDRGYGSGS